MPVILPPSTKNIPDGTNVPPLIVAETALNTGDVLTYGLASSDPDPGVTRASFNLDLYRAGGGPRIINRETFYSETNVVVRYQATAPVAVAVVLNGGGEPKGSSHGTAFGVHAETELVSLVYCQYGTELQPLAQAVYYLTPELITAWCTARGLAWMAPLFSIFWYTTLDATKLCGQGPPPFPPVDLSTLEASATTLLGFLHAIAWPELCRCTPGATTPVPFPPPSATQPVGWPSPPIFTCSNEDLCAVLIQVQQKLAALQASVSSNLELTTLLQRYGLPFAYVHGAKHSNISASGGFAVSRLVGVAVEVVARPGTETLFLGQPPYISDLGWLSILTPDGLIDEIRLTRSLQVWAPPLMATATHLGLSLRDGVVVNVTELQAEA